MAEWSPEALLSGLSIAQQRNADWFLQIGFDEIRSVALALAGANPAAVHRALKQGCSIEHAFEIWS